ncbi:MAG: alpha/beta fold hydrolase [Desulfobacterales bacterium]|nr:alpha/beta fold hydrolase [Desulfobacterales bacterium]
MNSYAYRSTGLAVKALSSFSKAKVRMHGETELSPGSDIFVINHFTRIETLILPAYINKLTGREIWSLADSNLFTPALSSFFDSVGVVSTQNPDRDLLMVKTLLTGEASWIVYPEGRMVKSKKTIEKGKFIVAHAGGKHPPHSGAATLALRTEFYRQRLRAMAKTLPEEALRVMEKFGIEDIGPVLTGKTRIIPVNITYYPIRARENLISRFVARLKSDLPERFLEELMTEGNMLLDGVDVDVRFGPPLEIRAYLEDRAIQADIQVAKPIYFDQPIPSKPTMRKKALQIMQQYMADIYRMTTVNHDHLLASIFRLMPRSSIHIDSLKRRAYLAACIEFRAMDIFPHDSLMETQTHLLTDDRYGKVRDFVELAVEKCDVCLEADRLTRDRSTFGPVFDFHRVRVDNPIAVIANEIEPLQPILAILKRIAWTPDSWAKKKVVKYLLKRSLAEFDQDYDAYHIAGESHDKTIGAPFLIKGRPGRTGVLLIHGYMAAPAEVRELAQALGRMGYWVYAPRLKGHGTAPEDLATCQFNDWIESVDAGYALLRNLCSKVVVGGFSNGAGLALELAARVPGLSGVFAISPPMRLNDLSARFVPAVDAWNKLMKKVKLEGALKTFVENHPENPHINYSRNPVSGVHQLEKLMDYISGRLEKIEIPALVLQAQDDPVVNPEGSQLVFKKLGSEDKTYILLNYDRHGIILGEGSRHVHRIITEFVKRL